jgi:hypothetical protein
MEPPRALAKVKGPETFVGLRVQCLGFELLELSCQSQLLDKILAWRARSTM